MNSTGKELLLPKDDPIVVTALSSSRNSGRVVEHRGDLELSLDSSYSTDPTIKAMMGERIAGLYEQFLKEKGFDTGRAWFIDDAPVRKAIDDEDLVLVRPCSLGGGGYDGIDGVVADGDGFYGLGRARGMSASGKIFSPSSGGTP